MKRLSLNGPDEYLALVIRRRWWLVIPFLLLFLGVAVITYHLPEAYVSETLILVAPRDVPEDFVKDLITVGTQERLDTVRQAVLSRTNLLRISTEFKDRLDDLQGLGNDRKVAKLSKAVQISTETGRGKASLLRIQFQHRDPQTAQRITSKFASLLIEYDNRTREEQVFGTTRFLESELESVSTRLQEVENVLAAKKKRYRYELPDQLDTNLRTLDRLHTQLQANTEALDRSIELRLDAERQISETNPLIVEEIEARSSNSPFRASSPINEYREKKRLLGELTSRYTDRHPDIRRPRIELDRLKKQIPLDNLAQIERSRKLEDGTVSRPNPVYQNLTTQLSEVKRETRIRERERDWIHEEIKKYNRRVQNAPQREQEMATILRSHRELTRQYENLEKKLVEGKLAKSLESRQKGTQFVIVDPANFPETPAKPNRPVILIIGMFASLGLGAVTAYVADFADQKFWTQAEVEELLGVPVLVEIPEIVVEKDILQRKKKRRMLAGSLLASALVLSSSIYYVYWVNLELRSEISSVFNLVVELIFERLIL